MKVIMEVVWGSTFLAPDPILTFLLFQATWGIPTSPGDATSIKTSLHLRFSSTFSFFHNHLLAHHRWAGTACLFLFFFFFNF